MRILDISVPLRDGMVVWPGDVPFRRHQTVSMACGNDYNLSAITTSVHAGTHMDAPRHFIAGGATVEQLDLSPFVGPCRVVEIANPLAIDLGDIERLDLKGVERLLFKTQNSALYERPEFVENYVGLAPDAARHLAKIETLKLVGVDYYSIAPFGSAAVPVHEAILGRGIVALEGINLREVEPGDYELIALPLRIEGSDGSPVRAVLIQR
ncbi:MAG: cyclase family protein [Candidatus Sumerlaeia bacterium]|nr:cyclase family protein [Candidatus Sumerlaeia bacterium]